MYITTALPRSLDTINTALANAALDAAGPLVYENGGGHGGAGPHGFTGIVREKYKNLSEKQKNTEKCEDKSKQFAKIVG